MNPEVLIIAAGAPGAPGTLADTVAQLQAGGARVTVAVGCPADQVTLAPDVAEVLELPAVRTLPADDRREHRTAGKGRKLWLRVRHDPRVSRRAATAAVIVALDGAAAYTVRQLGRRHRAADAVTDLAAARAALAERAAHPSRYATRRMLRPGPSPSVAVDAVRERTRRFVRKAGHRVVGKALSDPRGRRAGQALLTAPGLSDARRRGLGRRIAGKLGTLGLPAEASAARLAVAERMHDPAARAEWLMTAARDDLSAGRIPPFLTEAAAAELAVADGALTRGDFDAATRSVNQVMQLLFHRAVHFDWLTSPMAPDPTAFLAPLHNSLVGRTMAAPRGRREPAAAPPNGRPHRLLFVSRGNENFLGEIRSRYAGDPDFEVRTLNLLADPEKQALVRIPFLLKHKLGGDPEYADKIQEWLGPHLEWADTVFVEWCLVQAALFTMLDPGTTRIIVRLHLFEAFTMFPHLVDASLLDDLVFVSDPLLDYTLDVAPRLREPGGPRTHVVTNAARLDRYRRPKHPDARFTLAQIGQSRIAKDPRWTFEVLRELRRRDERYNLILVGADLDGTPTPQAAAYHQAYVEELAELEAQGAVRRLGQTDDVPGALTDVGVILSASVRESFHLGVIEGAASGAVPVVRDWPFFAGRAHSARSIFPADWMVETPAEAVERIVAHTTSAEVWRKTGDAAADHAMATWDWSVVQAQYDRLLQQP
ncbi:glycosyltransferase family 1 protein [Actinoplanes sp. NPDC004185]